MFCTKCGNEIREDMQFCPVCGALVKRHNSEAEKTSDFEKNNNQSQKNSSTFGRKKGMLIVGIIAFVLVIVIISIAVLMCRENEKKQISAQENKTNNQTEDKNISKSKQTAEKGDGEKNSENILANTNVLDAFNGTVNELAEMYGSDFVVEEGFYIEGQQRIYYEDKRVQAMFGYDSQTPDARPSGDEIINTIYVYDGKIKGTAEKSLDANMTMEELKQTGYFLEQYYDDILGCTVGVLNEGKLYAEFCFDDPNERSEYVILYAEKSEKALLIELKQKLVHQYGYSSQEPFVSCLGTDLQQYPSGIYGILSMTEIDLDQDKQKELFAMRVEDNENGCPYILAEVYKKMNGMYILSRDEYIHEISYCESANIYLFYSAPLQSYCFVIDANSFGAYTGADYCYAEIGSIFPDFIDYCGRWESNPDMGVDDNIEIELKKLNVPYAEYCANFDNRNGDSYYQPLCEIEHEVFGDEMNYETRKHSLCIKNTFYSL